MSDPLDVDFAEFFRDPPLAGLMRRDPARLRAFRERYKKEIMFASLHLNDLGATGGENAFHPDPPDACDLCGSQKFGVSIDGETADGAWANMCPSCFARSGRGIGWA